MGEKTVQVKMKWSFQGEVEFRNWANRLGCDWDIMQLSKLKKLSMRSVATILDPAARFDEMIIGPQRKYYFLGGKGGVGKTSCAASLAVKFADHGHPTIVISTDPAHSLSDSFSLDLAGRNLVSIDGLNSPLLALEINPDKAKEEFQSASQKNGGSVVKDFMNNMGLGMLADQLGDLKLGELLDTPPPGLDEAIAISKACTFFDPFLITFSVLCLPSFETVFYPNTTVACRLGRYAIESYLEQILSHGFFHADPVRFCVYTNTLDAQDIRVYLWKC
ncbi:ATPase GET3B-like [Hibiscus syriacus]|uniref:ATPase GET3B-like n=1 Tax=Hibiscus syriacus TaxID=106335 RepID=UPI00192041A6|nr:ATPase GET3B-like [Hibiscus syriacus]